MPPLHRLNKWAVKSRMNQDSSGTGLDKHTISQNVSEFSCSTGIAECKKSRYPLTQNLMQTGAPLRLFWLPRHQTHVRDHTSWFKTFAKTCCVNTVRCWRQAEHASITCSPIPNQVSIIFTSVLEYDIAFRKQYGNQHKQSRRKWVSIELTFFSETESRWGSIPCRAIKTSAGVKAGPVCAEPFTHWTHPTSHFWFHLCLGLYIKHIWLCHVDLQGTLCQEKTNTTVTHSHQGIHIVSIYSLL